MTTARAELKDMDLNKVIGGIDFIEELLKEAQSESSDKFESDILPDTLSGLII